ncbi:type I addiction module toxin, SymE family [Thalassomonas viridans]|uniref:Type I addiction module toxin, SymE family n=1 Tax=Thalassomonas viridans TaxID=137584 RepID=A0AAE9YYI1_9GAMM|nr:SymE family type I addiction module toxin [Thalassomonas viridans]WDE03355.1 type I addiction module toxin, SymE family [Thalassomonas viridans]
MAGYHHTPELVSAKVKYPIYRQLTVLETTRESSLKTRGIGINYVPVHLEPCIVLRGKWLRQTGFGYRQKVTVTINRGEINLTPKQVCLLPTTED